MTDASSSPQPQYITIPFSPNQQALWDLAATTDQRSQLMVCRSVIYARPLHLITVQRALAVLADRYPVLRATATPSALVIDPMLTIPCSLIAMPDTAERVDAATFLVRGEAAHPFDLVASPLVRFLIAYTDTDETLLILSLHQLIGDDQTAGMVLSSLIQLCVTSAAVVTESPESMAADAGQTTPNGLDAGMPVPVDAAPDASVHYWRTLLADVPLVIDLPLDQPRPATLPMSHVFHAFALDSHLAAGLNAHASTRPERQRMLMVLASVTAVLGRYSQQPTVVIGVPTTLDESRFPPSIGAPENVVPLVLDLADNPTGHDLLERVTAQWVAGQTHGIAFGTLLESLGLLPAPQHHPLVQVIVAVHPATDPHPLPPGLRWVGPRYGATLADLRFDIDGATMTGVITYNQALWSAASIERMVGHMQVLLADLALHPDRRLHDVPLLSAADAAQIVRWGTGPALTIEPACVHDLVAAQAARTPEHVAVMTEHEHLTYGALDARANAVAAQLVALGVGPDRLVGVCMDRSTVLIIAILAILKAGGAYVPLDPGYPAERLTLMVHDSDLGIVLVQDGVDLAIERAECQVLVLQRHGPMMATPPMLPQPVRPANLAYVIYTSGSTGRPKGVMVTHQSLTGYLHAIQDHIDLAPGDRLLQFASINFDTSIEEIFATLTHGATLVLRTDWMLGSAALFFHTCQAWGITVLELSTAYWHRLATDMDATGLALPPTIRLVVIGGEQALADRLRQWRDRAGHARLLNMYGPTETTIAALMIPLDQAGLPPNASIPIGRPLPGFVAYVLDRALNRLPIGVDGEIYLGGIGLTRGYLGRADLTAAAFVPDPFVNLDTAGSRMYRTGDRGRVLADGTLEFRGRLDDQIKVRGYRIEVGEIETALRSTSGVADAVVLVRADGPGDPTLVAYVIPDLAAERIPCSVVCTAAYAGQQATVTSTNLSFHGVGLRMVPAAWQAGQALQLTIPFSADSPPLAVHGQIAWVRAGEAGVALDLSPDEDALVRTQVAQLRAQQHDDAMHHPLVRQLEDVLRSRLPAYMIPQAWVVLPAFPLLPNGKLNRRALPPPTTVTAPAVDQSHPMTAEEQRLAALWCAVLGVAAVSRDATFVELGGNSLTAMTLLARIRAEFQVDLSLRAVFQAPTVAALAQRIAADPAASVALVTPDIGHADRTADLPLSLAQHRMWFIDQLQPGNPAYNITFAVHFHGPLDVTALEASLDAILRRHDVLRTSFRTHHGQPVQVIHPNIPRILPLEDLGISLDPQAALADLISAETRSMFDLSTGPLVRLRLTRQAQDAHTLVVTVHHSIFDGMSVTVFLDELAQLYRARVTGMPAALPPLPIQYADYAQWQRQTIAALRLTQQLAYWTQQLANAPLLLELPTDHPRPARPSFRGASERIAVPAALAAQLQHCGQRAGVTLFMLLLGAFQTLLYRYSDQPDIVVGAPIANRPHPDTLPLIGFFVNTLALRATLNDHMTVQDLLAQVRETCLQAYEHQDVPFDQVVDALHIERSASYHPLIQVMFIVQQEVLSHADWDGLHVQVEEVATEGARMDLALEVTEHADGLECVFTYTTDLFVSATIQRMARHFLTLLTAMVESPEQRLSQLALLEPAERDQYIAHGIRQRATSQIDGGIHTLIEAQVRRTPPAMALVGPLGTLSYAVLNERANQLARHLRHRGIEPGTLVALLMDRSAALLVGMLAVLKAGAAYVPLDVSAPEQRLHGMLTDTATPLVLTTTSRLTLLTGFTGQVMALDDDWTPLGQYSRDDLELAISPTALAAVIYTSGSTGQPKGVMVPHGALINFTLATNEQHRLGATDCIFAVPPPSFDALGEALFPALTTGAAVTFHPDPAMLTSVDLVAFCAEHRVTAIVCPTALWTQWCRDLLARPAPVHELPLRLMIMGGDSPSVAMVQAWMQLTGRPMTVVNRYGPTEATICATEYRITADDPLPSDRAQLPIGRPLANVEAYVLDAARQLVPIGVPGELYLGGAGLALGYLNQPESTAQTFVAHPFHPDGQARVYRTGDRVRWLADGTLEFLSRSDDQLKIRGYRIEPGEIEAVLRQHPAITDACVVPLTRASNDVRLVAYVVPHATLPPVSELRDWLKQALPSYMIPAAFMPLNDLPLTHNGKVDRRALPSFDVPDSRDQGDEPRTAVEAALVGIWAEVLGVPHVGIHDTFFDLGGHSLLAPVLMARVQEAFPIQIPLSILFEAATVAEFAAHVDAALNGVPVEVEAVDLVAEALLDPDICSPPGLPGPSPLRAVLLTGATGFLGAYLLDALLQQTTASVYCLVRADTPVAASRRITDNLARYGLTPPDHDQRVIPLPGDLERPMLGLTEAQFHQLATTIDAIYHNGGAVNFLYPYARLKAANVDGTRAVLRLACTVRTKPVHFVSSLVVYDPERYTSETIRETDPPDDPSKIHYGYEQSKWVADRLVRTAQERGLPVTIYRPARITGDSRTGATNLDDFFCRLIKGCIQLGLVPDVMDVVDLMPVDYLSAAMVALSLQLSSAGQAFHFLAQPILAFGTLVAWMRQRGYALTEVPFTQWRDALTTRVNQGEQNALAPLVPLFWLQAFDGKTPLFDCHATFAALADAPVPPLPGAATLLETGFAFMQAQGFLPPPEP